MRKIISFTFLLIFLSCNVYALSSATTGTTYSPSLSNVTYIVGDTTLYYDTLITGTYCVNITGGNFPGNYCSLSSTPINITIDGIPKIYNLEFNPIEVYTDENINATCEIDDFNSDNVNVTLEWRVNDVLVRTFSNYTVTPYNQSDTLDNSNYIRNDIINVTCIVEDSNNTPVNESIATTVLNYIPRVENVVITGSYPENDISGYCNITDYNVEICYQETANISTSCGGLDSGSYGWGSSIENVSAMNDGDYDTFSYNSFAFSTTYFYINYTIPNNVNNAIFQYKSDLNGDDKYECNDGSSWIDTTSLINTDNITVNDNCLTNSILKIRITLPASREFYEEGVYWNITYVDEYDNDTINASYTWYVNDIIIVNNSTGYLPQGIINVENLSNEYYNINDNVKLECSGYDGVNYSNYLNSSVTTILNHGIENFVSITDDTSITTEPGDSITINSVVRGYDNISNCTVYLQAGNETTPHESYLMTVEDEILSDGNLTFTLSDYYYPEGRNVSYWLSCYDVSGNFENSSINNFTVYDITDPVIDISSVTQEYFDNDTVLDGVYNNYLYVNVTFSDDYLFQSLVQVECDEDGIIYEDEQLDLDNSSYTLVKNVSVEDLDYQRCILYLSVSDDHTIKEIPEYDIEQLNNSIRYKTENDANIEIISNDITSNLKTKKFTDRYNFEFEYSDDDLIRSYTIKSDKQIFFREESKYPAHFVVWNYETNTGNWIDFALGNSDEFLYVVNNITDYEYDIFVVHNTMIDNETSYSKNDIKIKSKKEYKNNEKPGLIKTIFSRDEIIELEDDNKPNIIKLNESRINKNELKQLLKLKNGDSKYSVKYVKFNSIGGTNVVNATAIFYIGGVFNITSLDKYYYNFTNSSSYDSVGYTAGWTNPTNAFDGDWGTFATTSTGTDSIYFNYTLDDVETAYWIVKDTSSTPSYDNLTIENLLDFTLLQLKMTFSNPSNYIRYYYWNETDWEQLQTTATASTSTNFYEQNLQILQQLELKIDEYNLTLTKGSASTDYYFNTSDNRIENQSEGVYTFDFTSEEYVPKTYIVNLTSVFENCTQNLPNETSCDGTYGSGTISYTSGDFTNPENMFDKNVSSYADVTSLSYTNIYLNYTVKDNATFANFLVYLSDSNNPVNITFDVESKEILALNISLRQGSDSDDILIQEIDYDNFENTSCYQEFANVSTACGGLSGGNYNVINTTDELPGFEFSRVYDGDFDTAAKSYNTGSYTLYVNYSIPIFTQSAKLKSKYDSFSPITRNDTLPSDCLISSPLRLELFASNQLDDVNVSCWNYSNSSWNKIYHDSNANGFYEEAVYWIIGNPPVNTNISYPTITNYDSKFYEQEIEWLDKQPNIKYVTYNSSNAEITFKYKNVRTSEFVSGFTLYIYNNDTGETTNYSTTDTSLTLPFDANISYNVTFVKAGYSNASFDYTFDYLDQYTIIEFIDYFVFVEFIDEDTLDPFEFNGVEKTEVLVFCEDATYTYEVNSSNTTIPVNCDYDRIKIAVDYNVTVGADYYRIYIGDYDVNETLTVYLIDVLDTDYIYTNFILDDLLSKYINPSVWVKKNIENSTEVIHSDYIDIENKISTFLIKNDEYIIEVHSDNNPVQIIGRYGADYGQEKLISLYDVNLQVVSEEFYDNVYYTMTIINDSNQSTVQFSYEDLTNNTEAVQFRVYKDRLGGTLIYESPWYYNTSSIPSVLYNLGVDENTTVVPEIEIIHYEYGDKNVSRLANIHWLINDVPDTVGKEFLSWFLLLIISVLAIQAAYNSNLVSLGVIGLAALFVIFEWIAIGAGILVLALIVVLLDMLFKRGRK